MNREVILSEAGFRENSRVKGFRWTASDTLELWYNLPNHDLALGELRSLATALLGRDLGLHPDSLKTDQGSAEFFEWNDFGARARIVLHGVLRKTRWVCASYEAVH
jgi:hypothetical protein